MSKICPYCGAMVQAGALVCGTCHQSLPAQSVAVPGRGSLALGGGSAAIAYLEAEDGRRFPLIAGITRIGREPTSDVVLADSMVSGRHAEVEHGASGDILRDVGSTNGTYVNSQRIVNDCRLSDGDLILVGNVRLTFCEGSSSSAGMVPVAKTKAVSLTAVRSLLSGLSQPRVSTPPPPIIPVGSQGKQSPPPQASRDLWSRLFGPCVEGRILYEPKENQEEPPTDFSRLLVMLGVIMVVFTVIGAVVATMITVAILLVCLGAGALLFIVPLLLSPLQSVLSGLIGWSKDKKPITVIRFRVEDDFTGRPVEVVLRRKMGEGGGIYQNDRVQIWGSLRGGILYASKVRVEKSRAMIRAQKPWPWWIGLLALAAIAGQVYYLITLVQRF